MAKARLTGVSVEALKKEILRRRRALPELVAKRDELNSQIAELETLGAVKVAAKRGRKPGGRKRMRRATRAARPGSLASALVEVLQGRGKLSVAEAAGAVQASGYKSKSRDFQNIVGMTLSKDKKFRRVGRGQYTLKG